MLLFDLIKIWEASFDPSRAKVHLARYNGNEHPLQEFLQGTFDEWQRVQTGRNFERDFVVSLVQDGHPTRWLFAGLFRSHGATQEQGENRTVYYYNLDRLPSADAWSGRVCLSSNYTSRSSYLKGETLMHDLSVTEVLADRRSIPSFPGFKQVHLTKPELDLLVKQCPDAWRSALASVKGIYLISDTATGKLYVGKADGADGIWGRWCTYAKSGHGGNKALRDELGLVANSGRVAAFRFSILEIADLSATPQEILEREAHWKAVLLTKEYGHNLN